MKKEIYYHQPKKQYIPDKNTKRREIYATDEQFLKVQLYLDELRKEKLNAPQS